MLDNNLGVRVTIYGGTYFIVLSLKGKVHNVCETLIILKGFQNKVAYNLFFIPLKFVIE